MHQLSSHGLLDKWIAGLLQIKKIGRPLPAIQKSTNPSLHYGNKTPVE